MNYHLYRMNWPPGAREVLKELQEKIVTGESGCTVQGNRLTVRWRQGERLVHVHAVILDVEDDHEGYKCTACSAHAVVVDEETCMWKCGACGAGWEYRGEEHFER